VEPVVLLFEVVLPSITATINWLKQNLKFRSGAKPEDVIMVSGDLGSSTAGLNLFLKNIDGFDDVKRKHIEPEAKFYKVKPFLKYINAMIDVSDGLASEVTRICEQSKTGAIIYADSVPIKPITQKAAQACHKNALDFALYGGEDFELAYTVSEENMDKVKGIVVGKITKKSSENIKRWERRNDIRAWVRSLLNQCIKFFIFQDYNDKNRRNSCFIFVTVKSKFL